jgi:hypothetical protein
MSLSLSICVSGGGNSQLLVYGGLSLNLTTTADCAQLNADGRQKYWKLHVLVHLCSKVTIVLTFQIFYVANDRGMWTDESCLQPLASVCKSARSLYNTSTPPILAPAQSRPTESATTATEAAAAAAAAAVEAAAVCAVLEIRGRAALPEWTNVTGRYELQERIHNARPVYRRVMYYPPVPSAAAAVNLSAPSPGADENAESEMLLFSSSGGMWVVAPQLKLVLEASDPSRARIWSASAAAYPHLIRSGDWRELGLRDFQGNLAWRETASLAVTCTVAAQCHEGFILPLSGTREGDGGESGGGGGGGLQGGKVLHGGKVECFRLNEALLSFERAVAECEDGKWGEGGEGGVLTSVHSQSQHDVVLSLAQRLLPPSGSPVWMGLRRQATGWVWSEGGRRMGATNFSKWAPGEPDARGFLSPWLAGSVSQDAWWVSMDGGAVRNSGNAGAGVSGAEWLHFAARCGQAPPGAMSAAAALVDESLFVFGGVDADARFSDSLTVLRRMSAEEMAACPVVSGLKPLVPRAAGQQVTITGSGLCVPQSEIRVLLGSRTCTITASLSAHELVCQVPPGTGRALPVRIEETYRRAAALPAAPPTVFFNYQPPVVFGVEPPSSQLDGGARITVSGTSFGTPDSNWAISVGSTRCLVQQWLSDTALACTVPRQSPFANGHSEPLRVNVSGQTNADALMFRFRDPPPQISSVAPSRGPPAGVKSITLQGFNLGVVQSVNIGTFPCVLDERSADLNGGVQEGGTGARDAGQTVVCRLRTVMGVGLAVKVGARGEPASGSFSDTGFTFDVHAPVVSAVLPGSREETPKSVSGDGGALITFPVMGGLVYIAGQNFGDRASEVLVHIGETKASGATWLSDQRLRCHVAAGVGMRLEVRVQVAMQDAVMANPRAPVTFDYDAPLIRGLEPSSLPISGVGAPSFVTISGANFGQGGLSGGVGDAVVNLQGERGSKIMSPLLHSDSSIVIMVDEGGGGVVAPQPAGSERSVQVSLVVMLGGQIGAARLALVPASGTAKLVVDGDSPFVRNGDAKHANLRSLIAAISAQGLDLKKGAAETAVATSDKVLIVSITTKAGRRAPLAVVVSVRFLSALAAPNSGVQMMQTFASALRRCCLPRASTDADVLACPESISSSSSSSTGACANIAALQLQQAAFDKNTVSAPVEEPGKQPEASPAETGSRDTGDGPNLPSWLVPGVSIGVASACLLGGVALLMRFEWRRRREGDEDGEEDDDEVESDCDEKQVVESDADEQESERGAAGVGGSDKLRSVKLPASGPQGGGDAARQSIEVEVAGVRIDVGPEERETPLLALTIKRPIQSSAASTSSTAAPPLVIRHLARLDGVVEGVEEESQHIAKAQRLEQQQQQEDVEGEEGSALDKVGDAGWRGSVGKEAAHAALGLEPSQGSGTLRPARMSEAVEDEAARAARKAAKKAMREVEDAEEVERAARDQRRCMSPPRQEPVSTVMALPLAGDEREKEREKEVEELLKPRDSLDIFPSTDLSMLARERAVAEAARREALGLAAPAKVSAEANRARSQEYISLSSPPQTTSIPVRSPDLENSMSMRDTEVPARPTVEEVDSGQEDGPATAVTEADETGHDEAAQHSVRQDKLEAGQSEVDPFEVSAANAPADASEPAPLSPEDKRKKLRDFFCAAEEGAIAQRQESQDTASLSSPASRSTPNNGSGPQGRKPWEHSDATSTGAKDSTALKHIRLDPLPLPASREVNGRKLHSRQDLAGRPAQPALPEDAAGAEREVAPGGVHSGKRGARRKSSSAAAGDSRAAAAGQLQLLQGSWLDVLSRKHGAGGDLDDNGAPREDYARARALQAADKKQQGRAETAGPMCRRTTGEEEGEKGEQGQGDGGGALGVPDGGGGGCEANPGSADTEQTKTRVEPRAGSSKKKPRRVELSTATLTQTQHLHSLERPAFASPTRALEHRMSKDSLSSYSSPYSSVNSSQSIELSHSPAVASSSNPATPSSCVSPDTSTPPKSATARAGTFILRKSPKASGVLSAVDCRGGGGGGVESVTYLGGTGGKRDIIESHGTEGGEGAAAFSQASSFSLPSSPSAALLAPSTAEKKAARVRPPRLSHELIDFAPRGGGGGGGGVNAIRSSEGD